MKCYIYEATYLRHCALIPLLLRLGTLRVIHGAAVQFSEPVASETCSCPDTCDISKVKIRQDHNGQSGLTLMDVGAIYGGLALSKAQREMVTLGSVAMTSLQCLDDRVTEPSIGTPGGDLGEFILALSSYLAERDASGEAMPTQEVVDALLQKYVESV